MELLYMYVAVPTQCPNAIAEVEKSGLFVEPYRSPYFR